MSDGPELTDMLAKTHQMEMFGNIDRSKVSQIAHQTIVVVDRVPLLVVGGVDRFR